MDLFISLPDQSQQKLIIKPNYAPAFKDSKLIFFTNYPIALNVSSHLFKLYTVSLLLNGQVRVPFEDYENLMDDLDALKIRYAEFRRGEASWSILRLFLTEKKDS